MTEPLPGHIHPSETAYKAGCRCERCKARRRRIGKLREIKRAATGPVMTDTGIVIERLKAWMAEGFSAAAISAPLRIDDSRVTEYITGQVDRMRTENAAAILALTRQQLLDAAPDRTYVPSIGGVRRVRALMWMGWPTARLADEHPVTVGLLHGLSSNRRRANSMFASNHRAVAALFSELCMTPGPSVICAAQARSYGYQPPLAWDDIDDPKALPDTGDPKDTAEQRQLERLALWRKGMTDREIAAATGRHHDAIRRWRVRHGLPHGRRSA